MKRPESIRPNKWQIAPRVPSHVQQQFTHVPPILLQLLYTRGIIEPADIQAFLEGHYLATTDPFLLPDMDKAVARIQQAVDAGENIAVYGDFDADGVTSTVLLTQALRGLGLQREQVRPYIPDRVDEGYGLNTDALTTLKEKGVDLVISVDCGIRSVAEVQHANEIGLDMIITDHHSIGPKLPPATAVINPKRANSEYPERMLAGVGIAYKLAQALHQTTPNAGFALNELLDLVAIGTVADLAPLLGENRQLVIAGLAELNHVKRPGVAALVRVSGLRKGSLTAESIGFGLGPRINAAGRLAHAYSAARLLAVNNELQAHKLANQLNMLNKDRQQKTAELSTLAETLIEPDAFILIAADDQFLSGVVGLVASRLADKYYRPAVVIEKGERESRASCRSIPEFHITEALDELADLLERHGGHAQAAGFTILNENLPTFIEQLQKIAERELAGLALHPTISIDAEIELDEVDWALHGHLARLEPTGYANATPIFLSRRVEVMSHRTVGQGGDHLQLRVTPDGHRIFSAIAFRQGAWANMMPQIIDIVYTITVNEWKGRRTLQLNIQDIQPSKIDT